MPVWDGNPLRSASGYPVASTRARSLGRMTVQTALPQSPRCQVGCVDVPDPLLQAARLTGGKRCSDAVCGPGRMAVQKAAPQDRG